jgi:SAM-dependent methyltransferase
MWQDVVDLRDFYHTDLGKVARQLLRARIRSMWPDLRGQSLLGLGYTTPYLRQFMGEAERVLAAMPAAPGVLPWPAEGPGVIALVDETELPFQDYSIDRVLMVHALEAGDHQSDMLREVWRVLSGGGRLLVVVPNRRGPWSHSDKTPFGFGQPFTTGQATRLLRQHSFTPLRVDRALFFWPLRWRAWLRTAPGWERISLRWLQAFSGVIVIEATKQLYGAVPNRVIHRRSRITLPLPAQPLPTARHLRSSEDRGG